MENEQDKVTGNYTFRIQQTKADIRLLRLRRNLTFIF